MTGDRHLAERYGPPVRNESVPLKDWTAEEQSLHRAELDAAAAAYEAGRRKHRTPPPTDDRRPVPAGNPRPRVRGRQERTQSYSPPAGEPVAQGTTLEELLNEW